MKRKSDMKDLASRSGNIGIPYSTMPRAANSRLSTRIKDAAKRSLILPANDILFHRRPWKIQAETSFLEAEG